MQGSAVTREQKLALIIGFSLILAVGVLISDHLSRARTDTIIADTAIDQPMVVHRLVDVPPGMGEAGAPLAGRDAVPPETQSAYAVRETLPGMDQQEPQEPIDLAAMPRESSRAEIEPGVRTMLDDAAPGDSVAIRTASTPLALNLPGFVPVDGYRAPNLDVGLNDGTAPVTPVQTRTTLAAPGTQTQTPAASARVTHVVAEGETLYGIAARYYGNGDLWPELLKANKDGADAEGRVFEGVRLVIPERGGKPIAQTTAPTQAKPTQPASNASGGYGSYTIQAGDTLSEVSQKLMGTMRRMPELIELNKDQIQDADDIRVGMKLRYPRGQRA